MFLLWFLLALVLLIAALALFRLDAAQRRSGAAPNELADTQAGAELDEDRTGPRPAPFQQHSELGQVAEPDTSAVREVQPDSDAQVPRGGALTPESSMTVGDELPPEDQPQIDDGSLDDAPLEGAPLDDAPQPGSRSDAGKGGLMGKARSLFPARRSPGHSAQSAKSGGKPEAEEHASSEAVRWLEDREFQPISDPAPSLVHGEFANDLPALGTVSQGIFRGRTTLLGVSGGRTVLVMQRPTASDVVVELSRPNVDGEAGLSKLGQAASLSVATSEISGTQLLDDERLDRIVSDVSPAVRAVWAEGEWVVATVDGMDDVGEWDEIVVILEELSGFFAPLPPAGGQAASIPADTDPGAPGAAAGPQADPGTGADGTMQTGTPTPRAPWRSAAGELTESTAADAGDTPATAQTMTIPAITAGAAGAVAGPAGAGHLRLVEPKKESVRDLSSEPVRADTGDRPASMTGQPDNAAPGDAGLAGASAEDLEPEDTEPAESSPFDVLMEQSGPPPNRGDVAADFLPSRPPLPRPSRSFGQVLPADAAVPPLGASEVGSPGGIKPLGSDDDVEEIRTDVERFEASRTDGRSGEVTGDSSPGRHSGSAAASGREAADTPMWMREDVTPEPSGPGRGRHRAPDPDPEAKTAAEKAQDELGRRERPGVFPDSETTATLHLPSDIQDRKPPKS